MKALEKCYKNMTLKLVYDLRGHCNDLKWPQKVNITQGEHVHSYDVETRFFACIPHLQYPSMWKENLRRPPGWGQNVPPNAIFLKWSKCSHVAYQMKAFEKCHKNMNLKIVRDLQGHRSDLKWSQKVNITQKGHVHCFDSRNANFCLDPSFGIP